MRTPTTAAAAPIAPPHHDDSVEASPSRDVTLMPEASISDAAPTVWAVPARLRPPWWGRWLPGVDERRADRPATVPRRDTDRKAATSAKEGASEVRRPRPEARRVSMGEEERYTGLAARALWLSSSSLLDMFVPPPPSSPSPSPLPSPSPPAAGVFGRRSSSKISVSTMPPGPLSALLIDSARSLARALARCRARSRGASGASGMPRLWLREARETMEECDSCEERAACSVGGLGGMLGARSVLTASPILSLRCRLWWP